MISVLPSALYLPVTYDFLVLAAHVQDSDGFMAALLQPRTPVTKKKRSVNRTPTSPTSPPQTPVSPVVAPPSVCYVTPSVTVYQFYVSSPFLNSFLNFGLNL